MVHPYIIQPYSAVVHKKFLLPKREYMIVSNRDRSFSFAKFPEELVFSVFLSQKDIVYF